MPHVLCIDGGGTKTSAAVAYLPANGDTVIARGHAGPSNLTFGVDILLSATLSAISRALSSLADKRPDAALDWHPPSSDPTLTTGEAGVVQHTPSFQRVWLAYAGCGREVDRERLLPHVQALFPGIEVRLTGDAELLTAPMASVERRERAECVSLICGTGCLALLWRRDSGGMAKVGRSGGWGSLLGDEGSGWAMGKAGIVSALTASANDQPIREWHREVMAHFGVQHADELIAASARLDPKLDARSADAERKAKIAACARIVLAAADKDEEAMRVVKKIAGEVVEVLGPLVLRCTPKEGVLVVAGGLGQVGVFWDEVERLMRAQGWEWGEVVKMRDPAEDGVRALLVDGE